MDNSLEERRRKQFKVLYRFSQMRDKGRILLAGKWSLEKSIGWFKSTPRYQELIEVEGQNQADLLVWLTCWIVFLYQKFGPGKSEEAWKYYLEFIKEREGGEEA